MRPVLLLLLLVQAGLVCGQSDTTYVFRFVEGKDQFFVPYQRNEKELTRLFACVEQYRERIMNGEIPLHVNGYCSSRSSEVENLHIARIRSNRVKSELITCKGLKEACFITRNHASGGDSVTIRLVVPIEQNHADVSEESSLEHHATGKIPPQEKADPVLPVERTDTAADTATASETVVPVKEETGYTDDCHFALRANLLRWATLTPDLGLEWRIIHSWGLLVNGSWTSWTWNEKDRRYALWEVSPEVRYYIGKEKRGYLGAMYKAGQFNYKLSATGRQGDLMGGGITGGYQLRLNNDLSLDFNLGIGCVHADYEKYEVIDGVRVRQGTESKNWWGPVSAGVTLVWKIGASRAHKSSLLNAEAQPDL